MFFALHVCDEVHVYGFPPPGAGQRANTEYFGGATGAAAAAAGAGIGDEVTHLILRVLALEGYLQVHP